MPSVDKATKEPLTGSEQGVRDLSKLSPVPHSSLWVWCIALVTPVHHSLSLGNKAAMYPLFGPGYHLPFHYMVYCWPLCGLGSHWNLMSLSTFAGLLLLPWCFPSSSSSLSMPPPQLFPSPPVMAQHITVRSWPLHKHGLNQEVLQSYSSGKVNWRGAFQRLGQGYQLSMLLGSCSKTCLNTSLHNKQTNK